jgi:hypothetical protein
MRALHHIDGNPLNNDPANLRIIWFGPVTNCLDRSVYGPLAGLLGYACDRCGGYHDANARPLIGPCDRLTCDYASLPGGARHEGKCSDQ